jgi:hypothetical protein
MKGAPGQSGDEPHVDGEPSLLLRHAPEQRDVRGKHRANRRFTNPLVPLGTPLITYVMAASGRLAKWALRSCASTSRRARGLTDSW